MKHYLFASLTIVALFVLAWADAPAWLNLGIAGLLLTPLVFHVDDLKRQIEVLEWTQEGHDDLFNDLDAAIEKRDAEIRLLQQDSTEYRHKELESLRHNILNEIAAIKKVFTYPKITTITTDEQHAQLTRAAVEARLDWVVYLIHKSTETPEDREDRDLEREQESNYNRGLGV